MRDYTVALTGEHKNWESDWNFQHFSRRVPLLGAQERKDADDRPLAYKIGDGSEGIFDDQSRDL